MSQSIGALKTVSVAPVADPVSIPVDQDAVLEGKEEPIQTAKSPQTAEREPDVAGVSAPPSPLPFASLDAIQEEPHVSPVKAAVSPTPTPIAPKAVPDLISQRLSRVRFAPQKLDVSRLGGQDGAYGRSHGRALSLKEESHPRAASWNSAILFRGPRSHIEIDRATTRGRSLLAKTSVGDPKNHREAMLADAQNGDSGWRDAELVELRNHRSNKSFRVEPASAKPRGRNLVKFTWVYKTKRNGTKKARLCVQGCSQVQGVDYDQTFCASMRPTSLRTIAAIAAARGYNLRRWDFVAAYLQGDLLPGEVVYCPPPPGGLADDDVPNESDVVCVVVKPIYGMAQAGRRWQRSLFPWLLEYGFVQCHSDKCVFTLTRTMETPNGPRSENIIVGVYVDDLQIAYGHDDEHSLYAHFSKAMHDRWNVEDEGELADLLGVEFTRKNNHVLLTQTGYIERLVSEYLPTGHTFSKDDVKVPADESIRQHVVDALSDTSERDAEDTKSYQSIVGALLYCATHTRPDVAYSVGMLCRCMARCTPAMLTDARRVLAYLNATKHVGLRYVPHARKLYGMTDADWDVRHSTMGYVFMLHSAAISWSSKKQKSVALSTCEAEIMGASEGAKEAVYLGALAEELDAHDGSALDLFVDNKAAIDLAYNPEHHQKTKHIQRRHFYVRELVEDLQITVPFVASADNLADFFTKPLKSKQFVAMRDIIMNVAPDDESPAIAPLTLPHGG